MNTVTLRVRQSDMTSIGYLAYYAMLYEHIRPHITKDGFVRLLEMDCLRTFYEKAGLNGKNDYDRVVAEFMQVVLIHVGSWSKYLIKELEEEFGVKIIAKGQFDRLCPVKNMLLHPPVLNALPFLTSERWFHKLGAVAAPERLRRCFLVDKTEEVSAKVNFGVGCSGHVALIKLAVMRVEIARHIGTPVRRRDYDDIIDWYLDL